MRNGAVRLDPDDNVATALRPLKAGVEVAVDTPEGAARVTPVAAIPAFHKVALIDLRAGDTVRKYGAVIGILTDAVPSGGHVHVHNLKSLRAQAQGADT